MEAAFIKNVLVLCTGNSCRSILAEALINQLGEGRFTAVSAGSDPAGYVHPGSIAALGRHRISVGEPRSKSWDEFANRRFDLVITVCDRAERESCPLFLGNFERKHWSTPDPAGVEGTDEDVAEAFDSALMMLRNRIEKELL